MSLWSRLAGPNQSTVWERFATLIGAEFTPRSGFAGPTIRARVGVWTCTMDSVGGGKNSPPFTRLRAPIVNPDGFWFHVYRAGMFSGMATALGAQDIVIGDPVFDEAFVVKANDEERIRDLLTSDLRQRLIDQPKPYLEIRDNEGPFGPEFPEGVDELILMIPGILKERGLLRDAFDLLTLTLGELAKVGAAHVEKPDVQL